MEALIYDFDPLCGWCFAFGPSMQAATQAHPDLPVILRYGGLVTGERVGPLATHRSYLVPAFKRLRQVTGIAPGSAFTEGLLAEGRYISDSEPPCRGIYVMQQLAPAGAYGFAAALPDVHYRDGQPLDDIHVLSQIAAVHGADPVAFATAWQSDTARKGTQVAFAQARAAGVATYPTLRYRYGTQLALVAEGFASPDATVAHITALRAHYATASGG